jgi:hypothetical protein
VLSQSVGDDVGESSSKEDNCAWERVVILTIESGQTHSFESI